MRKFLSALVLVAAIAAPAALHASPITGQFSIDGTVTNTGSELDFVPGTAKTGMGTQTGTFAALLTDNELLTSGSTKIVFSPSYTGGGFFTVGSLTAVIDTLVATNFVLNGTPITAFSGTATFSAAGYDTTDGVFSFSTQANGPVTFSATGIANSPVPEPSTLALFGTGALGLGLLVSKRFA